ncbi:malto-oligosyltrehalose synthase [Chitinophaga qingshengii]|uniref:Malto-oligosyltrehalose synthase n=1 Tax=Chitinophaga qingshengii TaxID=1569794 RepID=A0ABR7TSN2_9BACT|nr:malto-oligosyltrehalose synthase [Chitinophaga qingshengii]MBC9933486.1 malto-oligosyltrehalose synthase [Chitinophaga qingshengii]
MRNEFFTPVATYRIQFNKDFTFTDLEKQLDYLHQLGITTIYASPVFETAPGSHHGYDITNPREINSAIGSLAHMRQLHVKLRGLGMSWIQDIVPNYMAFHCNNARLMDTLERGTASPYYNYFDIDWHHPDPDLHGKLMVPFLKKTLRETMDDGGIRLSGSRQGLSLAAAGQYYPLSAQSYKWLLNILPAGTDPVKDWLTEMKTNVLQRRSLLDWDAMKSLLKPPRKQAFQPLLNLVNNNTPLLYELLDLQHYTFTARSEADFRINYRRFLGVNEHIALRMEDKAVFDEYHGFLHRLYQEGIIQGLRIDQIDGLLDPAQYIYHLRELFGNNCYIIAEKMLAGHETLPERWAVQGSTGYDFLAGVSQLLTDAEGMEKLGRFYRTQFPGFSQYSKLARSKKQLVLEKHMNGEWDNLVREVFRLKLVLPETDKGRLKMAMGDFMVCLPENRIYPEGWPFSPADVLQLDKAVEDALLRNPATGTALELIRSWWDADKKQQQAQAALTLLKKITQFAGQLYREGVEETLFYVYNALLSHNETGDSPVQRKFTLESFHERMAVRQYLSPFSLNTTATQDTRWGEDARIRLNALTIIPDLWIQQVEAWHTSNREYLTLIEEKPAPDLNDEYFIYQAILAGMPVSGETDEEFSAHITATFLKTVREAKVHSSWLMPDTAYELACLQFIEKILAPGGPFVEGMRQLVEKLGTHAHIFSLAQTLIKITAPGIPDIYQGCELWDFSAGNGDGRHQVNYTLRRKLLFSWQTEGHADGWPREHSGTKAAIGKEKLYLMSKALQLRNTHLSLFIHGEYIPLTSGERNNQIAFARKYRQDWCIVAAPLLPSAHLGKHNLAPLSLPANAPVKWKNVFTGEILIAQNGQLLLPGTHNCPVALLSPVLDQKFHR